MSNSQNKILYFKIGKNAHYFDFWPNDRQSYQNGRAPFWRTVCFKCNLKGHVQPFCFRLFPNLCSYCTFAGHVAEDCERRLRANERLYQLGYVTARINSRDPLALAIAIPDDFVPRPPGQPGRRDYRAVVTERYYPIDDSGSPPVLDQGQNTPPASPGAEAGSHAAGQSIATENQSQEPGESQSEDGARGLEIGNQRDAPIVVRSVSWFDENEAEENHDTEQNGKLKNFALAYSRALSPEQAAATHESQGQESIVDDSASIVFDEEGLAEMVQQEQPPSVQVDRMDELIDELRENRRTMEALSDSIRILVVRLSKRK